MRDRTQLVRDLLEHRRAPGDVVSELQEFAWDSEPLVTLQSQHILWMLDRFATGEIDATEVIAWADAVEVRDDVGRPADDDGELSQALFELSTPLLFPDFDQLAQHWQTRLNSQ